MTGLTGLTGLRNNWRMREDLEKLLELQRKTKAGEVAPLVGSCRIYIAVVKLTAYFTVAM